MDLKKLYIEHAVYPAMALLKHNQVVARTKELLLSEVQDSDQRDSAVRQRVSELLRLCRDRVPVYSDLPFTDLELRREPMDCLLAVDPMPLNDFLSQAQEHLLRDADPDKLLVEPWSEQEEKPVSLYMTEEQLEGYEAARWRGLSWYGVTYGSSSVMLWDKPRAPYSLREEPYMKNRLTISICAMTRRSVQPTIDEIDRFEPEYISGSASGLAQLAAFMDETGVRMRTHLKVVTITRGVVDAQLRHRLSQIFGCPVAQTFGVRSEGVLAYMCPEGHLHVTAENCLIELLDPLTWEPVAPGQLGMVAVTDLLDTTMPHLRVLVDYMARWDPEPCACGRTLPVLTDLRQMAPSGI